MTKSVSRKTVSLLLAFVMVFGVLLMPNITEAKDADIDKTEEGSYIKLETKTNDKNKKEKSKDYIRITTIPDENNEGYKNVVRGNIFLTYPEDTKADLTAVPVTLTAQKEFGFTLNGKTVEAGDSDDFTLDLTKENIAELNIPEGYKDEDKKEYEEGSYVITGAKEGEKITITTEINVDNPKNWLTGDYEEISGFPVPDPKDPENSKDVDYVQNAITGFDSGKLIDIFNVDVGTTAMDVLAMFGEKNDMDITGISQGYISYMGRNGYNQIGEFDINSYSGWMYTVDEGEGKYFPNVGASAKTFDRDTKMIWHFTMAYGQDIDAPWGEPGGDPGMPYSISAHNLYRTQKNLTIGDIVSQWANSNRPVESIK
ncbi:MAG: DUF4430 domain-containing protein [Clostridiaceae bacterium]|nr:DUF4430 domain-containing protein [Clostridiaceae bacterium]MBW4858490.1 DUF4430 domain-containing protein [Clostridiaceae bacterium]MBW4869322.1 DUF4430 domain-containing protein [Clostridiaceae bacterium]